TFIHLPRDDELSLSEASAVKSLARVLSPEAVVWSDHRIATAFLYYEPRRFTTLDLAYDSSIAPTATVAVFYGNDCQRTETFILGTGANVVILTEYMRTEGIVQRAFPLNPSEAVFRCL